MALTPQKESSMAGAIKTRQYLGFGSRNRVRNSAPKASNGGRARHLIATIKTKDDKFHRGTQVEERRIATHDIAINS